MQDLSNITTLDLVIVALYLLGMLGIGVYFVRRIQNGVTIMWQAGPWPLVLANGMCNDYRRHPMMGKAGLEYDYGSLLRWLRLLIPDPECLCFPESFGRIQEVGVN